MPKNIHVKNMSKHEETFYINLGKRLSAELKKKGITQEKFAEILDISVGMARNHLKGTRRMYLYKYLRIAGVLGINGLRILAEMTLDFGNPNERSQYLDLCEKIAKSPTKVRRKISDMLDDETSELYR